MSNVARGSIGTGERRRLRSRRILLPVALLGLVIVAAAGLQGPATFTGLRWSFEVAPVETVPEVAAPENPPASAEPLATAAPAPVEAGGGIPTLALVVVGLVAAIVALYLLRRWLAGRPPRSAMGLRDVGALTTPPETVVETQPAPEPEAPVVLRGVEEALRLLDSEREPGDAVMKAWLGLTRSAEEAGIRRSGAETPTEFTRRILRRVSADDRAVGSLLTLYLRARFGDHPVTAGDVVRAREALEALARSWDDGAVPAAQSDRPRGPRSAGPTTWPTS